MESGDLWWYENVTARAVVEVVQLFFDFFFFVLVSQLYFYVASSFSLCFCADCGSIKKLPFFMKKQQQRRPHYIMTTTMSLSLSLSPDRRENRISSHI